jgi:hypothetical protein
MVGLHLNGIQGSIDEVEVQLLYKKYSKV